MEVGIEFGKHYLYQLVDNRGDSSSRERVLVWRSSTELEIRTPPTTSGSSLVLFEPRRFRIINGGALVQVAGVSLYWYVRTK